MARMSLHPRETAKRLRSRFTPYYGESIVRRMEPTYPRLPEFIDRARFWAGTLELQWALAGVLDNNIPMLLAHVGAARDVQLLGAPLR